MSHIIEERTTYRCPACNRSNTDRTEIERCIEKHERERPQLDALVGTTVRWLYFRQGYEQGSPHPTDWPAVGEGTVVSVDDGGEHYWHPRLLVEVKDGTRTWVTPEQIKALEHSEAHQAREQAEHAMRVAQEEAEYAAGTKQRPVFNAASSTGKNR